MTEFLNDVLSDGSIFLNILGFIGIGIVLVHFFRHRNADILDEYTDYLTGPLQKKLFWAFMVFWIWDMVWIFISDDDPYHLTGLFAFLMAAFNPINRFMLMKTMQRIGKWFNTLDDDSRSGEIAHERIDDPATAPVATVRTRTVTLSGTVLEKAALLSDMADRSADTQIELHVNGGCQGIRSYSDGVTSEDGWLLLAMYAEKMRVSLDYYLDAKADPKAYGVNGDISYALNGARAAAEGFTESVYLIVRGRNAMRRDQFQEESDSLAAMRDLGLPEQ